MSTRSILVEGINGEVFLSYKGWEDENFVILVNLYKALMLFMDFSTSSLINFNVIFFDTFFRDSKSYNCSLISGFLLNKLFNNLFFTIYFNFFFLVHIFINNILGNRYEFNFLDYLFELFI